MFTKFDVRLWLMYSLFPGLLGAAAVFALLQGYGNSALTIFGGIGAALLIGLIAELFSMLKAQKDIKEQQAAQLKNEREQSAKNMSLSRPKKRPKTSKILTKSVKMRKNSWQSWSSTWLFRALKRPRKCSKTRYSSWRTG